MQSPSFVRGARAFSLCSFKKHTSSTNNTPLVIQKKKLNEPVPAFPPTLRLKEPQTKLTSLIPPERLSSYKKSLGRIFDAATPPGALVEQCDYVVTRVRIYHFLRAASVEAIVGAFLSLARC